MTFYHRLHRKVIFSHHLYRLNLLANLYSLISSQRLWLLGIFKVVVAVLEGNLKIINKFRFTSFGSFTYSFSLFFLVENNNSSSFSWAIFYKFLVKIKEKTFSVNFSFYKLDSFEKLLFTIALKVFILYSVSLNEF